MPAIVVGYLILYLLVFGVGANAYILYRLL